MTTSIQKLAGRLAVALLLVLLAAGTVFATAATRPAAHVPAMAEPTATPTPETPDQETPDVDEQPQADESPDAEEAEDADESPSPQNLARIVERLADREIVTTADELAALSEKVGVGGAVRVLILADASGKTPAEVLAMFEAGAGWGVIAKELEVDVNPGLGWVMGNGAGLDKADRAAEQAERAASKAERAAERAAAKAQRAAERAERKAGRGN